MTTKRASKSSGPEDLPVRYHRKIKCRFDIDLGPVESRPGWHFSGIYRAGYAVGALLDAGVR